MQAWGDPGAVVAVRVEVVHAVCGGQSGDRRGRAVVALRLVFRVPADVEARLHVLQALHEAVFVAVGPEFGVVGLRVELG